MSGPHAGFILAAYAFGFCVVAGLIVFTWADWRAQSRALKALEGDGARRRAAK